MATEQVAAPAVGSHFPSRIAARLVWAPLLAVPVFLGLLAWRLPRLIASVHTNSDATAPALIAEAIGSGGANGGPTIVGDISYLSTLGVFLATRWLPGHRVVWDAVPIVAMLATSVLIAWAVSRVAGRWAAALALALSTAIGTDALFTQIAPAFHGATWLSNALLGFALVWAIQARPAGRRGMLVALGLGAVIGANLASDPLLAVTGLAPFAVATWLVARSSEGALQRDLRRLTVLVLGTCVAVAVALTFAATAVGFRTRRMERGDSYLVLAAWDDLVRHLDQLWRNALAIFGAGRDGGLDAWPDAPLAAAALIAFALVVGASVRALFRAGGGGDPTRRAHLVYWGSSSVLLAAAFVLSGIPDPDATLGTHGLSIPDRYLVPFVFSVAAVIPVWAAQALPRRALVAAIATLLCGAATAALATADLARPREALPAVRSAGAVESWAREKGLRRGYADYWTASAFTYRTGIPVRAVIDCELGERIAPCALRINARRGWFRAADGESFVIVDRSTNAGRIVGDLVSRGAFGFPVERRDFGRLTVVRYERDVALTLRRRWGARSK